MARKKRRGPASGLALHHELYTVLRHKMDDGVFPAGSALPSEPDLAREYAVSRTTVRRALVRLAREKRVDRVHGSGTYVRDYKPAGVATSAGSVPVDDLRAFGRLNASKLLTHRIVPTPPALRAAQPEFGERSLLIERTRSLGNEPLIYLRHYIPEAHAPSLTERKLGQKPTVVVFDDLGLKPTFGEQIITCIAAPPRIARALKLPMGSPLLVLRRYVTGAKKELLEFQELHYRPERFEFRASVWREYVGPSAAEQFQPTTD